MDKTSLYRQIPKVDELLVSKKILKYLNETTKDILKISINQILTEVRDEIKNLTNKQVSDFIINKNSIIDRIIKKSKDFTNMNLKKVINGTGVIIHTNLGRSCLNKETAKEVLKIATGYSNLEFNLDKGSRGHRYDHIENLICRLTGAEAAMIVNNNAAAVMLVLDTLAKGKEGIVSRGELVEIGGSFRVPDVMKHSGTILKEVGTTNKTHLSDYEEAIDENTGILVKIHTSNYRVVGFTDSVDGKDLVNIGKKYKIPVYEDLGSGLLFDFSKYIETNEPTVKSVVESGIDVVSFSGDKMLGGPQAGIIIGKKKYIEKMKYNQLTRALRVDKMTFAALEMTLRHYLDEKALIEKIPTIKNIIMTKEKIKSKAIQLKQELEKIMKLNLEIIEISSQVGGGSMPLTRLDSFGLKITFNGLKPNILAKQLRICKYPVVGRITNDQYILDLRTIEEDEFDFVKKAFIDLERRSNV